MAHFLKKFKEDLEEKVNDVFNKDEGQEQEQEARPDDAPPPAQEDTPAPETHADTNHRFSSFAPQTTGHAKWHVDGASYFWAVSIAIEEARESIYILDWWLTPELYLRRPPSKNEQYRLDNMLRAAAERGVSVHIIVYKEVPQALTLNSEHTKHALEALHPNIKVFRHPDHHPSGYDVKADLETNFQNLSLRTFDLAKFSQDALKTLYGTSDDVVLYWAHHEKLCLIDGKIAFMGGLDMCFGRWDTNSHPIADAHPGDVDAIVFPGQDYNNARVYDFEDVQKWENNKLDRTKSSRMGWSDISISLSGPIVDSLIHHFTDRWNYIFNQKYLARAENKYAPLERAVNRAEPAGDMFRGVHQRFQHGMRHMMSRDEYGEGQDSQQQDGGQANIQLTRSASQWSAGHATEHSIANAYIDAITNARHFVYIENQFFITATSEEAQRPITNQIGRAIVDRVVRAHQSGEPFQVTVLMPAVPAFAGDLKSDGALGTRAIMEFQYNSISRGGHSILESLVAAGVDDPSRYINFYNLRCYDRLNLSATMASAEAESGVRYEAARREFDDRVEQETEGLSYPGRQSDYAAYQSAASRQSDTSWDSVAACYMHAGPDLRTAPWTGSPESELDAFVSEELYIHSKVLIADDRLVICGSANLNDRSQLGDHDSEIAVVIEDPTPVESTMAGQPYTASLFATTLRRQLFRKHLGLLPHQAPDAFDSNWTPVSQAPNSYDFGSEADELVSDPLSDAFLSLWRGTARTNTEVFSKVFHPVPNDAVRTWADYDAFFSRHFIAPGTAAEEEAKQRAEGRVDYGHVVREEFPDGGVGEVKEWLARVRGTLVEMPLGFLADVEDLAKEGLSFNGLTDDLYT
ncbi:phospholipase D/nuclease [Coniochaeta ligniaria NRRL 30616]|uniref:Phospholipase n=1 Tax=Coniochaeta ligniaria NRRL 30616 TaxID=1408157 RepID=A0A1J7ILA1_9PEZI|nr:phospholipase D/nuclease [Coniochaeta ligniaria NRRL 30616]